MHLERSLSQIQLIMPIMPAGKCCPSRVCGLMYSMAWEQSSYTGRTAGAGCAQWQFGCIQRDRTASLLQRNRPSFQEPRSAHSAIFQVLGFNSPAVCHQFWDRFHPRVAICHSTFVNPKRTPDNNARKVFTTPYVGYITQTPRVDRSSASASGREPEFRQEAAISGSKRL